MATVKVAFRGLIHVIPVSDSTTIDELSSALQAAVGSALAPETMKLLRPKGAAIALADRPEALLSDAGIAPGMRLMLVASAAADVAQLRAAKEQRGMMSFEAEERRAAQRRRRANRAVQLPTGPHTFGSYQVLEHTPAGTVPSPPPKKALTLLHRLAADTSISSIMRSHGWSVGLLSEMPPEGKVGISAMCVLGYNVNKGQEISLRLRTDDWRGFRKYARIRETLIHELAHMVWSEHDNNFKTLNSQLLQECARADVASGTGHTLAGDAFASLGFGSSDDEVDDEISHEAMRATAALSGRTLRQLAAAGDGDAADADAAAAAGVLRLSPREAAAEAAVLRQLKRQQRQQQQQRQRQIGQPIQQAPAAEQQSAEAALAAAAAGGAAAAAPSTSGRPGSANSSDREEADEDMHYDLDTEEAEMQLRRLGTLDGSEELPQAVEELLDRKLSGQLLDGQLLEGHMLGGVQGTQEMPDQHKNMHEHQQQQQQQQAAEPVSTPPLPGIHAAAAAEPAHQTGTVSIEQAAAAGSLKGAATAAQQPSKLEDQPPGAASAMDIDAPAPFSSGTQAAHDAAESQHSQGAATAAAAAADIDRGSVVDDPAAERLRQAQSALQELLASTSAPASDTAAVGVSDAGAVGTSDTVVALDALAGVLGNVSKGEAKYRHVKGSGLRRRLGRGYEAGLKLLQLAGFGVEGGVDTEEGQVLVYARNDPGLLWLVSSVVREQLQQQRIEAA